MNKLQLIRKEIERLKDCASPIVVCDTLLQFIDSIQEEPKGKGFFDGVDFLPVVEKQEPISEDLDFQTFAKEMDKVFALPSDVTKNTEEDPLNWEYAIARHFAEWGRNHFDDMSEIVSEDLEKASWNYSDREGISYGQRYAMQIDFKAGADWQQKQDYKRFGWHDAKKEQPPMDEEVIVLTNVLNGKELNTPRRICFGHIVDKEICVDYDGWNIPGVAYWMYDPKLKEEQQ